MKIERFLRCFEKQVFEIEFNQTLDRLTVYKVNFLDKQEIYFTTNNVKFSFLALNRLEEVDFLKKINLC